MTENGQNIPQNDQEAIQNDKEQNLGRMRQKYEYALAQEAARREELERQVQEMSSRTQQVEEEEDTSDPYVDHKRLDKKLSRFGQNTQKEIKSAMDQAKYLAKEELKQEFFLENNADFHNILDTYSEDFARKHPKLAENILRMPQGFERQKLVYQTIKELGVDKPKVKENTIQEKVDANRRSPYYQPSGVVGSAPYSQVGDFSQSGQKNAYDKMKDLQKRMRI